jgi:hypothetical protein
MKTGVAAMPEIVMQSSNAPDKPVTIHLLNMSNTFTMMRRAAAREALGRHSTLAIVVWTHAMTQYQFDRNAFTGEDYGH